MANEAPTKAPTNPRRQGRRLRRRLPVRFWWGDELEGHGFTNDISGSGMLIETNKAVEIGQRLHAEVDVEGSPFFVECVVVRRKVYPRHAQSMFRPIAGVRFVTLAEELAEQDDSPESQTELATTVPTRPRREAAEPKAMVLPQVDLRDPAQLREIYERDIKHGGLQVRTTELPEIYSEFAVPVFLPAPHGEIDVSGTVVKLFDDPPGFAMRLAEVDAVRARILEILRSS